ncbi:MFS transporter [Balneatrix alpica]|uniref:Nitrate/nitrite transporter n=1 Tax=Balneatrix alpica TaxID=75684 RepID=A0ABV5ZD79_9GAMM|nr:MFS transporter [Balneatrix alpica]
MRMAVIFGMNQVVSHGFGMFLFAAVVPLMRDSTGLNHWHLALVGALTQLAYLAGALALGVLGPKLSMRHLARITGMLTASLLWLMPHLQQPSQIILALVVMAASAAMSWGAIVEIVSHYAPLNQRATYLSTAASGTAWGYGLSGLMLLWIVPSWGWQSSWQLAGLFAMLVIAVTWQLLRSLPTPQPHTNPTSQAISPRQLLKLILTDRTAFYACFICFLVGFCTMPFSNWLNTYLLELQLPSAWGGYSWFSVGLTGMLAGVVAGKLADQQGHVKALLFIFSLYAVGQLAFAYHPWMVLFASITYGLMYFPMWGIVAGWINQTHSPTATMQISGICMVTFGLGGTLGNLILGFIHDYSGRLQPGFLMLAAVSCVLVGLSRYLQQRQRTTLATDLSNPVTHLDPHP